MNGKRDRNSWLGIRRRRRHSRKAEGQKPDFDKGTPPAHDFPPQGTQPTGDTAGSREAKRRVSPDNPEDRLVLYVPTRCPKCHSKKTRVTSTRPNKDAPTIRYHKCRDCGHNFKSIETADERR